MILAVTGQPIAHSLSPDLHQEGFRANGLEGAASFRIIADDAKEAVNLCRQIGVRGLNITSPFKQDIAKLADSLSPEAESLQAVNTLLFDNGKTTGFNSDIYGVSKSLEMLLGQKVPQKTVLLGAGGAARAVSHVLKELGFQFVILNRSLAKAQALAREFSADAGSFENDSQHIASADLLINCLSTTEAPFDLSSLHQGQYLLDAHYKTKSALASRLIELGAQVMDGHNWLLLQGIRSQQIFFETANLEAPELQDLGAALRVARQLKNLQSVALVGLMGSGKSESGALLAEKLGLTFVDLDAEIEKAAGMKISEIFDQQGEESFRDLETSTLHKFLAKPEAQLISCGGGIVLRSQNCSSLREKCKVIWLWASVDTLVNRLEGDSSRPLLKGMDLKTRLTDLLAKRKILYAQAADLVINTDNRQPAAVTERIINEIGNG